MERGLPRILADERGFILMHNAQFRIHNYGFNPRLSAFIRFIRVNPRSIPEGQRIVTSVAPKPYSRNEAS